jgi:hypothetical protein
MRSLVLVWTTVLLAPFAWSVSLVAMFWLTTPVCQGLAHSWLVAVGAVCVVLAIVGGVVAHRAAARWNGGVVEDPRAFLFKLARGASAIFALVIALSIVPIALLTPCPV